ncbi:iron uptake porin [Leptolyngbya sp. AN02str]|uniref:iron uptake porin n=1 Tax=Leptolyngbya sp. AN02str TaxID=3423363 RepID=UPI003D32284D
MKIEQWTSLLVFLLVGSLGVSAPAAAGSAAPQSKSVAEASSEPTQAVLPSAIARQTPTGLTSLDPAIALDSSALQGDLEAGFGENGAERTLPIVLNQVAEPAVPPAAPAVRPLIGQVTSVTQLSDVQPTDWAYEALSFLANSEELGGLDCLEGYPDGLFRGNRPITRYEFAAGLAACLDAIPGQTTSTDIMLLIERLQGEFASELAALSSQVDLLEGRTAALEAQQFSTTTILRGNAWFNLTQAFPSGDILAERSAAVPGSPFAPPVRDPITNQPSRVLRGDPQATLGYLVWLTLSTSFTGRDALVTQLAAGNATSPANQLVSAGFLNTWGTPFLDSSPAANNQVILREFYYSFPIGDSLQVDVGPRLNYYRYFDGNAYNFFINGTSSFNSNGSTLLNAIDRGSGAVVRWSLADPVQLTVGYMGESTEFLNTSIFNTASKPGDGLFNGTNTLTAQLAFSPSSNFNFRVLYNRSNIKAYNGFIGGAVGEPLPYGYADDGFGGFVEDAESDTFVANFDWRIAEWLGVFGRYSYGRMDIDPVNVARAGGDIRVQSFQAGLAFPDLGKQGALGTLSFLIPHDYLEGQEFLLSGGGDGGTQFEVEATYYYPLTRNVALVPAFYAIWNANNFESNPAVYVGNLRMQLAF